MEMEINEKENKWIENNTQKNQFYQIEIKGRKKPKRKERTPLEIISPTLPFEEQMKLLEENINQINQSINEMISQFETTSIDEIKKCEEEIEMYHREKIHSMIHNSIESKTDEITDIIIEHKHQLSIQLNNQIDEYEKVSKPIKQFDQHENCLKTIEMFEEFEQLFSNWKPITEKIIWTYQERYNELEDIQNELEKRLENWHKKNHVKNQLIDAVHSKYEKKIIGLFEGHRELLLNMKLDIGLLLRLIECLCHSLTDDIEKRVCFLFQFNFNLNYISIISIEY